MKSRIVLCLVMLLNLSSVSFADETTHVGLKEIQQALNVDRFLQSCLIQSLNTNPSQQLMLTLGAQASLMKVKVEPTPHKFDYNLSFVLTLTDPITGQYLDEINKDCGSYLNSRPH